jgi:hypothetical protein
VQCDVIQFIKPKPRTYMYVMGARGGAVVLRHCATSLKVAGSIPDGVSGIFH